MGRVDVRGCGQGRPSRGREVVALGSSIGRREGEDDERARGSLTGRELVLARRRHVMETLDLLLTSQLDE
jgi:hypothetical protein